MGNVQNDDVQRLKSELEQLRHRLASNKHPTVRDYFQLTEAANQIAKAALSACQKRASVKQRDQAAAENANNAAVAAAPAANGAASDANGGPQEDDGVTCLLHHLPKGWGVPRLQAYVERFGAKPSEVTKPAGDTNAIIVFESIQDRSKFYAEFQKAEQEGGAASSAGQFTVRFPGKGMKRPAATATVSTAAGCTQQQRLEKAQQRRPTKQAKADIREVVCPWWGRPYKDQLNDKMTAVKDMLRHLTEKVSSTYPAGNAKPDWLASALRSPSKQAATLPGIIRSPQVNGYRNKAEFTVGLDGAEQPIVGFLLGNFVDGITQVGDPAGCRHMSPTALAYAAAMTAFLRSSENKLPAWDKRCGKGFWRLLVVREGRSSSFLPLPTPAAQAGNPQQAEPAVLQLNVLADVPLEKWLVRNPDAADVGGADGLSLSEVTETEPAAPPPSEVMVMVQVDPSAAPGGEAEIRQQLQQLAARLTAATSEKGLVLSSLLVQHHSGVSNAAPQGAPLMALPKENTADWNKDSQADGLGCFSDALCDVKFRVSPMAFFQINNGATCLLYTAVGRMAAVGPETLLLDVCCGTGTIGITLAKRVAAVIGIDNVESAIADARMNAALNGITNAEFVFGAAEDVMEKVLQDNASKYSDVVAVVDPPRAGLHRNVLRALLGCAALKRLVFVSCNPDTLLLNARLLCGAYRPDMPAGNDRRNGRGPSKASKLLAPMGPYTPFRPSQVLACDLFPHTKHVETVMLFER